VAHLDALAEVQSNNADSVCSAEQRMWYIPPLGTWDGNPTDITGMNGAFDR
jgi:hypothetical protein